MAEKSSSNLQSVNIEAEDVQVELMKQTAKISWRELQRFFASGKVIEVVKGVDLVSVGVALVEDNTSLFEGWTSQELVRPIPDTVAAELVEEDAHVWALAIAPWVLVQRISDTPVAPAS